MVEHQHSAVTVSASASPSEVISAIIGSASNSERSAPNPNRWFLLAFAFVLVFAGVVYFREEIYTVTTDLHKHPILNIAEALQIRQNLGSRWHFEDGKDDELTGPSVLANVTETLTGARR